MSEFNYEITLEDVEEWLAAARQHPPYNEVQFLEYHQFVKLLELAKKALEQ